MTYRPVPSLPGLWAGSDGSIWSHRRRKPARLSPYLTSGRQAVACRVKGRRVARYVSRLVLEAFVGPCPDGMECCHFNGDRLDNRLENLRWDTRAANADDARRHRLASGGDGLIPTAELALAVLALFKAGFPPADIATRLGLKRHAVYAVIRGATWSHVTGIPKHPPMARLPPIRGKPR